MSLLFHLIVRMKYLSFSISVITFDKKVHSEIERIRRYKRTHPDIERIRRYKRTPRNRRYKRYTSRNN